VIAQPLPLTDKGRWLKLECLVGSRMADVLVLTSGKGGVGKTTSTVATPQGAVPRKAKQLFGTLFGRRAA